MNTYLVKVKQSANITYELSMLGKVTYVSSILNIFSITTDELLEDIEKLECVEYVKKEDAGILV